MLEVRHAQLETELNAAPSKKLYKTRKGEARVRLQCGDQDFERGRDENSHACDGSMIVKSYYCFAAVVRPVPESRTKIPDRDDVKKAPCKRPAILQLTLGLTELKMEIIMKMKMKMKVAASGKITNPGSAQA